MDATGATDADGISAELSATRGAEADATEAPASRVVGERHDASTRASASRDLMGG
jgi:hypothetical protein